MRYLALAIVLIAALFAGCLDTIDHNETDGGVDTPQEYGSGSAMARFEESPRDGSLELVVLGASAIIALVPIGARRREDKETEPQL